jgi:hypothetical protein
MKFYIECQANLIFIHIDLPQSIPHGTRFERCKVSQNKIITEITGTR